MDSTTIARLVWLIVAAAVAFVLIRYRRQILTFLQEVMTELKKSSWPTRQQLVDSTVVVVVTMLILGIFVALADMILLRIVALLLHAG
ncbi:MAG: preprotein translocase subunit SecE [Verrucomicrobiae bacterium]|nr:preprotein translocase subunit SecE [Verrucomicrobiae bacterium]